MLLRVRLKTDMSSWLFSLGFPFKHTQWLVPSTKGVAFILKLLLFVLGSFQGKPEKANRNPVRLPFAFFFGGGGRC